MGSNATYVDFQKMVSYGTSAGEVWRRPTPPTQPPRNLLPWRLRFRQGMLEEDDYHTPEGGGVLLPYGRNFASGGGVPANLTVALADHALLGSDRESGLRYTFRLVEVPEEGEAPPLPDTIVDLGIDCENDKVPRRLEFPASNAAGLANRSRAWRRRTGLEMCTEVEQ